MPEQEKQNRDEAIYDIRINASTGAPELVLRWIETPLLAIYAVILIALDIYLIWDWQITLWPIETIESWVLYGLNLFCIVGYILLFFGRTVISIHNGKLIIRRNPVLWRSRVEIPLEDVLAITAEERLSNTSPPHSEGYWIFLKRKNAKRIKLLSKQSTDEAKQILDDFIAAAHQQ